MRPHKVILIADHDADRRGVQSFRLWVWNYKVLTADSAEEAREIVERRKHTFALRPGSLDLVLVEHSLPLCACSNKPGGLELVSELKRKHPSLPCLVLSDDLVPLECEADVFLPKGGQGGAVLKEIIRVLMIRKRGPLPRVLNAASQAAVDHAHVRDQGLGIRDQVRKPPQALRAVLDAARESKRGWKSGSLAV